MRKAEESFSEALTTIKSADGWKVEKQTPEGDVVHSKYIRRNHKIFRITVSFHTFSHLKTQDNFSIFSIKATVDIPPKLLYDELDRNIEHVPTWNPTLIECRVLKVCSFIFKLLNNCC